MQKITVVGTTCIDIIKWTNSKHKFKSFGGIIYLITALSGLFKQDGIIYPVTKIERKYYKNYLRFLKNYPNIKLDYIYDEPGKTNIVTLIYDEKNKHRCEKSFLGSTPIKFTQIKPVINFSDIMVITYISGYDISLSVLEKLRNNYKGIIYGDIHSFILTRCKRGIRRYKNIKNYEQWIKNFDILQGNEIEWQILLKNKFPKLKIVDTPILAKIKYFKTIAKYVLSVGVNKIIMTMGEDGVIGAEKVKNKITFYNIPGRKVKNINDTTGCGDTLTAGVIWGLLTKNNFKSGLEAGNYLASIKVKKLGFFTSQEIYKKLLSNIRKY